MLNANGTHFLLSYLLGFTFHWIHSLKYLLSSFCYRNYYAKNLSNNSFSHTYSYHSRGTTGRILPSPAFMTAGGLHEHTSGKICLLSGRLRLHLWNPGINYKPFPAGVFIKGLKKKKSTLSICPKASTYKQRPNIRMC